jgi:hypothetical protein
LSRTYEDVIAKADTVSNRMIDLSVKLDHLSGFPRKELFRLADQLSKNFFSLTVLKRLVWYHFYLYDVDFKIKQAVSDKLGMTPQPQMLNPKHKLH